MHTAICTLFENDYHYGVGILANSLYHHGFRGDIWAGYRGELPPWAAPAIQKEGYQEMAIAEGCVLRFIPLETQRHFAFFKPEFMSLLFNNFCPDAKALIFFDADIVNRGTWEFYERWVQRGIALCEDAWAYFLPSNHPIRAAWTEYLEAKGYPCVRLLNRYYNAGFIGLPKIHASFLTLWAKLMTIFDEDKVYMKRGSEYCYPYINAYDQDTLNIALMVSDYPMTTVGPEGMDFNKRGFLMSHAAGNIIKPWRKNLLLKALSGVPPSHTDKLFWSHAQTPIPVYPTRQVQCKHLELKIGAAIGRFVRRS